MKESWKIRKSFQSTKIALKEKKENISNERSQNNDTVGMVKAIKIEKNMISIY